MWFVRSSRLILVILLAQMCSLAGAWAQAPDSSDTSIANAAKRARERLKDAASAKKVITDDDLSTANMKPGDEGLKVATPELETEPPSPAAVATAEAADATAAKSPADTPVKETDSPKLKTLKEELAKAQEDLELSQRESALLQDTVYSNPDYQHDTAGKAKLDALQQQISDKQQKVDEVKARLAALEEAQSHQIAETPPVEKPAEPPQN